MANLVDASFEDNDVDPAADFLLREQSQLAGLEDDLNNVIQPPSNSADKPKDNVANVPQPSVSPNPIQMEREEPLQLKNWREEQKKRLDEKDANEEKKKEELRAIAMKELEEWYNKHGDLVEKIKEANRNAEKQFVADVDDIEPGTEWERISKLCDFNPKSNRSSKDTSRMRSIILQLKQSPLKKSIN